MRNLLVAFFVVCTIWSCGHDNTPSPQQKSTQSTSGIDTFTGMWVTNFFSPVNDPDTFLNTTFTLERYSNDSAMNTQTVNANNTKHASFLSTIDTSAISWFVTYLHGDTDSGWHEVYLFGAGDSIYYHSRSKQDTNIFSHFYGTN